MPVSSEALLTREGVSTQAPAVDGTGYCPGLFGRSLVARRSSNDVVQWILEMTGGVHDELSLEEVVMWRMTFYHLAKYVGV
jgi:hypothetical protein